MSFYPMIFSLRLAFWRQHPCPFHFHLFCFEVNINIQFPHPFMDTFYSIIRVFHYFCLSLFAGWTTSVLSFPCLFLGGKYFKSMFCWHIKRQQWVKVNRSKLLRDFLDFSLDSTSNILEHVLSEPLVSNPKQIYDGWELTTMTNQLNCNPSSVGYK